jgi:hypothetical protein
VTLKSTAQHSTQSPLPPSAASTLASSTSYLEYILPRASIPSPLLQISPEYLDLASHGPVSFVFLRYTSHEHAFVLVVFFLLYLVIPQHGVSGTRDILA